MGGQYGGYLEPNLEKQVWQKLLDLELTPSLGARSAQIRLEQRQDGNNNAQVYWDNVVFTIVKNGGDAGYSTFERSGDSLPAGENYIKNASFDANLDHWRPQRSKRLNWQSSTDGASGVIVASLSNSRESGMGTGSFKQCVNFGSEKSFQLGARVKVDPQSLQKGGGRLRATWYQDPNCKGRYRGARHHADVDKSTVGWQTLNVSELIPLPGSTSVSIGVVHSIEGAGEHILFWDDFYFRSN